MDLERAKERFKVFNERGGKFRVAITNVCNLDCFFCHNEGMPNPRRPETAWAKKAPNRLTRDDFVRMIDAFSSLGGTQVNLTGGEPLASPDLVPILETIERRKTRNVLNTNALLAERLLERPKIEALDAIYASLHTTKDEIFSRELGAKDDRSAARVMKNIALLRKKGYAVQINFSLGPYNKDELDPVLDFAIGAGVDLKAIAFVRPDESEGFYKGEWVDPRWVTGRLEARGAELVGRREGLGGRVTCFAIGDTRVDVKNVAVGRLATDFCAGCPHLERCGEGIYALRVGVDGVFKPCLLNREKFIPVRSDESYEVQILAAIDSMIGDFGRATFRTGAPT
jgi:cyclic pyranopterin phosphate synthase